MILVRDPCVVSPLRGLSSLRRGTKDIRDARDTKGFEKVSVKKNSAFVGVLEGGFLDEGHVFDFSGGQPPSASPALEAGDEATDGEQSLFRTDLLGG